VARINLDSPNLGQISRKQFRKLDQNLQIIFSNYVFNSHLHLHLNSRQN